MKMIDQKMNSLLYYPYINLPKNDWTIRALLYYDKVNSIVPAQYFYEPEHYDPFMREAIMQELITPINPMDILDKPNEVSLKFIEYLETKKNITKIRHGGFISNQVHKIHGDKFSSTHKQCKLHVNKFDSDIFAYLIKVGLAERIDCNWYNVENKTANDLMFLLSSVIADKIKSTVATDGMDRKFSKNYVQNSDFELRNKQYKRDLILKDLMPYPKQIDLTILRRFKEKHHNLLVAFRNKVESIVLNQAISPESKIFEVTLNELKLQKEELSARMHESHLSNINFGTICGTVSAAIGLFDNYSSAAAITGLLSAIYSVCKIERPESVIDQTGIKYLALVDKRMRRLK